MSRPDARGAADVMQGHRCCLTACNAHAHAQKWAASTTSIRSGTGFPACSELTQVVCSMCSKDIHCACLQPRRSHVCLHAG